MSNDFRDNPYASPTASGSDLAEPRRRLQGRVIAPAIALMIVSTVGLALSVFNVGWAFTKHEIDPQAPELMRRIQEGAVGPLAAFVQGGFAVLNGMILLGGAHVGNGRRRRHDGHGQFRVVLLPRRSAGRNLGAGYLAHARGESSVRVSRAFRASSRNIAARTVTAQRSPSAPPPADTPPAPSAVRPARPPPSDSARLPPAAQKRRRPPPPWPARP
jgi:hypothetical protein